MPSASDHRAHPITRAELARRAGKARSTITGLMGGPLLACALPQGRVDVAHPVLQRFAREVWHLDPGSLFDAGVASEPRVAPAITEPSAPAPPARTRRRAEVSTVGTDDADLPQSLRSFLDWRLGDITDRFGSAQGFTDWLEARKLNAETHRLESRNERDAGRLISREFVRQHVIGYLGGLHCRLLADAPRSAAAKITVASTLEDRKLIIAAEIGAHLRDAKHRAMAAVNACRTGDNPPAVQEPAPEHDSAADSHGALFRALRAEIGGVADALVTSQWAQVARLGAGDRFDPAVFARIVAVRAQIDEQSRRRAVVMLEAMLNRVHLSLITHVPAEEPSPSKTEKGKKNAL